MSAWVPFTVEEFRNGLPIDFLSQHDAWVVAHSSKAERMAEIVDEVVNRFRSAAASNPRNQIDADETKIPATGYDYAFAVATYTLGLEMGMTSTGAVAGVATVNVSVPVSVISNGSDGGSVVAPKAASSSTGGSSAINFMDAMRQQVLRAEVWLRLVQSGALHVLGDLPFGTPTFNRSVRRPEDVSGILRDDGRVVEGVGGDVSE